MKPPLPGIFPFLFLSLLFLSLLDLANSQFCGLSINSGGCGFGNCGLSCTCSCYGFSSDCTTSIGVSQQSCQESECPYSGAITANDISFAPGHPYLEQVDCWDVDYSMLTHTNVIGSVSNPIQTQYLDPTMAAHLPNGLPIAAGFGGTGADPRSQLYFPTYVTEFCPGQNCFETTAGCQALGVYYSQGLCCQGNCCPSSPTGDTNCFSSYCTSTSCNTLTQDSCSGCCVKSNQFRGTLECMSNRYGLTNDYSQCWTLLNNNRNIPGNLCGTGWCLYECPATCVICNTGLGAVNNWNGCQDTNPYYQNLVSAPQYMVATYTLSPTIQVNCRMPVCASENGNGCLNKQCLNGLNYVDHVFTYDANRDYIGMWINDRCDCSDTFGDAAPNWYCTVNTNVASTPSGADIHALIDSGTDVQVICSTNANYFSPTGTSDKPYLCIDTTTQLILGLGPWPYGVYMVVPGGPPVSSSHKGFYDYYVASLSGSFSSAQLNGNDWNCYGSGASACSNFEPILFLFSGCSGQSGSTAFPSNFGSTSRTQFLSQACEWVPLSTTASPPVSTNTRDIPINTFTSAYLGVGLSNVPISNLYTNSFPAATANCYTLSYATGNPVISATAQSGCFMDSLLSTAVLYPGYTAHVTSGSALSFAQWYATWWLTPSGSINTVPSYTGSSAPPAVFTPRVESGDVSGSVPSYTGINFYDTFPNDALACPSASNQQQVFWLQGYGILSFSPNVSDSQSPPISKPMSWGDPGFVDNWALDSDLNDFIVRFQSSSASRLLGEQFNHGGSMFWSHKNPADCTCNAASQQLFYYNISGLEGCYSTDFFCVPGNCICQQTYFEIPWPELGDYTLHSGHRVDQPFAIGQQDGSNVFSYHTNIKCNQSSSIKHHCDYTKQYVAQNTIGSNTTCTCLNGWSGPRCDVCDPQALIPWFSVSCSVTCRSPDGSVIGHAACLNGGLCTYNSQTVSASCTCASGFAGTYCQYPTQLTLGCSSGLLPFICNLQSVAIPTQFVSAFYTCSLGRHAMTLSLAGNFVIFTQMDPLFVTFSPPGITDAQQLWVQPLVNTTQLCPSLFSQIYANGTIVDSYAYYCPPPYNNIYPAQYDPTVDTWCQLSPYSMRTFIYFMETLYCYPMSVPLGLYTEPGSLNQSYFWCHSDGTHKNNRMDCLMSFPISSPYTLATMTLNEVYEIALQQCNPGQASSLLYFSDYNNCDVQACLNGGTCVGASDLSGNYTCTCATSYTGPRCASLINNCPSLNPCLHGGTCVTDYGAGNFHCSCTTNYTGATCQLPYECALLNNPCLNGGTCINITNPTLNYTCSCVPGFVGRNCQTISSCHGVTCPLVGGLYSGICVSNGTRVTDYYCDYCNPQSPCMNGGTCTNLVNYKTYTCTCAGTWSGPVCTIPDSKQSLSLNFECSLLGTEDLFGNNVDVSSAAVCSSYPAPVSTNIGSQAFSTGISIVNSPPGSRWLFTTPIVLGSPFTISSTSYMHVVNAYIQLTLGYDQVYTGSTNIPPTDHVVNWEFVIMKPDDDNYVLQPYYLYGQGCLSVNNVNCLCHVTGSYNISYTSTFTFCGGCGWLNNIDPQYAVTTQTPSCLIPYFKLGNTQSLRMYVAMSLPGLVFPNIQVLSSSFISYNSVT